MDVPMTISIKLVCFNFSCIDFSCIYEKSNKTQWKKGISAEKFIKKIHKNFQKLLFCESSENVS